jgi:choline-glycine betaine transporter
MVPNTAEQLSTNKYSSWFNIGIKHSVFWPPFLLLLGAMIFSFVDLEHYLNIMTDINDWILTTFSWLFSISTLCLVITLVITFFSPLGKIKIGGSHAKPLLTKWQWFAITLCTTVATGILFWGAAEPMYHFYEPPVSLDIAPQSEAAARFTMGTMFMHWSFTPYAIYCVPALAFALCYYNLQMPFSLGSSLKPFLGKLITKKSASVIDAVALFALVAGMASSLGSGILVLGGGLESVLGIPNSKTVMALVCVAIVVTFVASAVSGLQKGIARLSNLNAQVFIVCCIFVLVFGPTQYIFSIGIDGMRDYVTSFFSRSLNMYTGPEDIWPKLWTIFYWANWYAWAPVVALFLGRIGRGYTVREFIVVNLILPSIFAFVWMSTFSGSALYFDSASLGGIKSAMDEKGVEGAIYTLFEQLPISYITAAIFVFITFISYVTAADSNTDTMSNLCAADDTACVNGPEDECTTQPDDREPTTTKAAPLMLLKFIWGISIGVIAWVMVSFASIDGIKMMSNLGGLPAMFIIICVNGSLLVLLYRVSRGDKLEPPKPISG